MSMHDTTIDHARVEAFAGRMAGLLNEGALALMVSIGHRTGLFGAMAQQPSGTVQSIAEAAGLNERYVREWLGAVVTGGIVEHDHETDSYHLPAEHAALLTTNPMAGNMAIHAQFIPLLGGVEDGIVKSFHQGGGVPYVEFNRFHDVMAEVSGQTFDAALFAAILPLSPGLAERLKEGIRVLDIGCGQGYAISKLAERYPNSGFVGYDFCDDAVEAANAKAAELGLDNLRYEVQDVSAMSGEKYHLITAFDVIHDQAKPAQVLQAVADSLTDDGVFLMQDIRASSHLPNNMAHPLAPFLYSISCMHCMTVSLALDGEGLGTMWGEEKACEMLAEAGFSDVDVETIEADVMNNYYIARKS